MCLRIALVIFISLVSYIDGESFDRRARFGDGPRSFVAPDITDLDQFRSETKTLRPEEVPVLSEFNYYDTEVQRQIILSGIRNDVIMWNFLRDSEVSSITETTCRKCMVAGNLECIKSFCRLHVHMKTPRKEMKDDVHQKAFATGTALHGDILCSLCKHTRDVMCTMKLCVDPERGQNAVESGVQCMQGFCRWQKETVVNTGFSNNYHAWWQPQNLFFFFDHVTKEIATAYNEFVVSTSKAIHGLG